MTNLRTLLTETANLVADYRDAVSDHRVAPEIDVDRFRATFGGPFSAEGVDAATAIEELVAAVEPVLTASSGPRYFGFTRVDRSMPPCVPISSRRAGTRSGSTP